jgi:hypothetical protein
MIAPGLIERAHDADLLATAERLGAKLKRATSIEWTGACILCAGTDRFSVNVRKRIWHCRRCQAGGDVIDLVRHVTGVSFAAAVMFLTGGRPVADEARMVPTSPRHHQPAKPDDAEEFNALMKRHAAVIVRELGPLRGTPGKRYLAEPRKIDTEAIADVLERMGAIGWHPSVLFREHGHPLDGKRLGCIVSVMSDPITGELTGAISRTYIGPDGVKVGKAKTLGRPAGIIRLSADEDVLLGLHLGEGLETVLDVMSRGLRPAWACGSASLMASFPVLAGIECLTLIADHGEFSGAGLRAASEASRRWRSAGRETHVFQRDIPGDLNDAFKEIEP